MTERSRRSTAIAVLLVAGAVLGMAGTFVPSASARALLWGIDGTALVIATALLTVQSLRRNQDLAAAGFLVFVVAETLIVTGSAMDLAAFSPVFAAAAALWAASLTLVGLSGVMPRWINAIGFVAALLFAITAVQIFLGTPLTLLSQPLPFFAFPFLAATMFGWAWAEARQA